MRRRIVETVLYFAILSAATALFVTSAYGYVKILVDEWKS